MVKADWGDSDSLHTFVRQLNEEGRRFAAENGFVLIDVEHMFDGLLPEQYMTGFCHLNNVARSLYLNRLLGVGARQLSLVV